MIRTDFSIIQKPIIGADNLSNANKTAPLTSGTKTTSLLNRPSTGIQNLSPRSSVIHSANEAKNLEVNSLENLNPITILAQKIAPNTSPEKNKAIDFAKNLEIEDGVLEKEQIGPFMESILDNIDLIASEKNISKYDAIEKFQEFIENGAIGKHLQPEKKAWLAFATYGIKEKILAETNLGKELLKHPIFKNLPIEQAWKMVMNHSAWNEKAPGLSYENEPGYIGGMLRALEAVIKFNLAGKKLNSDLFQKLHDIAVGGVLDQDSVEDSIACMDESDLEEIFDFAKTPSNSKDEFKYILPIDLDFIKEKFRGETSLRFFSLTLGNNISEQGLRDMLQQPHSESPDFVLLNSKTELMYAVTNTSHTLTSGDIREDDGILVARLSTPEKLAARADEIIDLCRNTISSTSDEKAKVLAIAQCAQSLERAHMFMDGNARTVGFLVIPMLLLEAGLTPAMIANPNKFDGFSDVELSEDIRKGQEIFLKHAPNETKISII